MTFATSPIWGFVVRTADWMVRTGQPTPSSFRPSWTGPAERTKNTMRWDIIRSRSVPLRHDELRNCRTTLKFYGVRRTFESTGRNVGRLHDRVLSVLIAPGRRPRAGILPPRRLSTSIGTFLVWKCSRSESLNHAPHGVAAPFTERSWRVNFVHHRQMAIERDRHCP